MKTTTRPPYSFALGFVIGGLVSAAIAYLIVSQHWENLLPFLLPYAIVLLASLLLGIAELIDAFGQDFSEAIATVWSLGLLGANAIAAEVAFICILQVRGGIENETNPLALAAIVGFGFSTLIRTRFTLTKSLDSQDDLSIRVDWIYDTLQKYAKIEIDGSLEPIKEELVNELCKRRTKRQLYRLVRESLDNKYLNPETSEESGQEVSEVDRIYYHDEDEVARYKFAQKLLKLRGCKRIRQLLSSRQEILKQEPFTSLEQQKSNERVRRLSQEKSLDNLIAIAKERLPKEALAFAENAIQDPNTTDEEKKSTIACLLVINGILS